MNLIGRIMCFFGWHPGELFRGTVPACGITVMKRCACGRLWYDAAGPFVKDLIWIPISDEEAEEWWQKCATHTEQ